MVIYLDNAATSWPKPPGVKEAMAECLELYCANPGRGGHKMSVKASRILFETRVNLSKLFGIKNPNDVSFAANTTAALNQAIKGFVKRGDHVILTSVEHNSVRRPLEYLRRTADVQLTYVHADRQGRVSPRQVEEAIRPNTRLVVVNHSSNLLGTVLPVADIGEICRRKGVKLLVDAAQTAGTIPIDVENMSIDMLAFPGHKGLLGPQGTGGLYVHPSIELEPLMHGGTGSQSESIDQPNVRPDQLESGTQNTVGIAGLNAGIKFIQNVGIENIHNKEWMLVQRAMEGLMNIEGVSVFGPLPGEMRTGIVSFNLKGIDSSELAHVLDQHYDIAVRAGYHCTPLAHETAGTLEHGAVRVSPGFFNTEDDIDQLIDSVRDIARRL
jgi:cysteine desulfurase family protein